MKLDAAARRLGLLALVPTLALPLSNPDLFWHLSAARRIRETGTLPAADWLSSTRAGAPWVDFEWISQLLFDACWRHGGMPSLWALKAALMAASAFLVLKTLELYAASAPARWAALALWGAASLTRSDVRPELFSLLGFGLVFLLLERRRLGRPLPAPGWFALLFCAWANLHPGFVYGLALLGLYAAADAVERRGRGLWPSLAAAAAGCLVQAYGLSHLEVILRHWRDLEHIRGRISEWRAVRLDDPWHWPFWIAFASSSGAALLMLRRGRRPAAAPLAALLFFGFTASRHNRMTAYSVACAVPLLVHFLVEAGAEASTRARRALLVILLLAAGAFSAAAAALYGFPRRPFNDHWIPRRAAEFLALRAADLPRRALYNPWGWGGYLGWRLHPDFAVFQDGRYIFHDLLTEEARALESPDDWQAFLGRHGIDLALMENAPLFIEGRPYYVDYMPGRDWALVYRDEQALLFARRATVPAAWIQLNGQPIGSSLKKLNAAPAARKGPNGIGSERPALPERSSANP